jgi:hypothetical protein
MSRVFPLHDVDLASLILVESFSRVQPKQLKLSETSVRISANLLPEAKSITQKDPSQQCKSSSGRWLHVIQIGNNSVMIKYLMRARPWMHHLADFDNQNNKVLMFSNK